MKKLAVVDLETMGLNPAIHDVFEIALILRDEAGEWSEHCWWIDDADASTADSAALRLNRYFERNDTRVHAFPAAFVATEVARLTTNATLVGCNTSFDAAFLEVFLRRNGAAPAWDYRTIAVEVALAGKLGVEPPFKSEEIARRAGVDPGPAELLHTAMADARMARAMYEVAFGQRPAAVTRQRKPAPEPQPAPEAVEPTAPIEVPEVDADVVAVDEPEPRAANGMPNISMEHACEHEDGCSEVVAGEQAVMSWTRYRRVLCKPHFSARKVEPTT